VHDVERLAEQRPEADCLQSARPSLPLPAAAQTQRSAAARRRKRPVSSLTLVIGNKNYSSWSPRPWLFLKHAGVLFAEIRIPLNTRETRERIAQYSPSGRVPVLLDGSVRVRESLTIYEHIAERSQLTQYRERR
jgi:hypothetical protein